MSGAGDTGTSSRSFGTLLSWLSDHKSPVFVIGTSNNFTILPPEMIRKGRFDELFWLDLPTDRDKVAIFSVLLKRYGRDPQKFDIRKLSKAAPGFTGAEIEQVLISAMFKCFSEGGREIKDSDLLSELSNTIPQSKVNEVELSLMRDEARNKLRMAGDDGIVAGVSEELRQIAI